MKHGGSRDECSEYFAGPYAFSEPESKLVGEFISSPKRNLQMFVSLSGYGRKISFDSIGLKQHQIDDARDVARGGLKNIRSTKFSIDSKSKRSGSIDQFAMHEGKIKYSYNIETRDDAYNGFFVPASSIEDNAEEMFDIIYGMVKKFME
jgi:hypothetical protein